MDKPSDMDVASVVEQTENMDSEEVLSKSDSAEVTENADYSYKAIESDEKPKLSTTISETTSGIHIGSESITLSSEIIPKNVVETIEKPDQLSTASGIEMDTPSESIAGAEQLPRASELLSAIDIGSFMLVSEIPSEPIGEAEQLPTASELLKCQQRIMSASETICKRAAALDSVRKSKEASVATGKSSPAKRKFPGSVIGGISPTKVSKSSKTGRSSSKSKSSRSESRSTSKSPRKTLQSAGANNLNPTAEAIVASKDDEKHTKKKKTSPTVKKLINFMSRRKSSSPDKTSLVPNEEKQTDEPDEDVKKPEEISTDSDCVSHQPECELRWTEDRVSLTDVVSLGGTSTTDVPSISSGAEVFTTDSRKSSPQGGNTLEDAVVDNLASSVDERMDIQESDSSKDAEEKENKDDTNPENGN